MPTVLTASAFLFDMDGTLVDSHAVVERVWARFAKEFSVDIDELLAAVHGVRMEDSVRRFAPAGTDVSDVCERLAAFELAETRGVVEVPGAAAFLRGLPADRWAVVTSAPRALTEVRLSVAGAPEPEALISAESVTFGKPHPEPYRRAAELLGVDPADTIVFEDADAGIRAGLAAGATVVVVGPHRSDLTEGLPRIPDFRSATADQDADGRLRLALA